MPARLIREGILTSDRVELLNPDEEVFYRRLMSKVDDRGLYDARPSILRASLYPLRLEKVSEIDCTRWLEACQSAGLVFLYETDGKRYLQMLDTRWQVRSEPKYPLPPVDANGCNQSLSSAHLDGDVVVVGIPDSKESGVPGAAGSVPCPHEKVISLYHELLPSNPRIVAWNTVRQGYLRSRWREQSKAGKTSEGYQTEEAGIAWWRKFLGWVGQSKFLTGQIEGRDGKPPFLADLEWIVRPRNFVKILEGKYHRG